VGDFYITLISEGKQTKQQNYNKVAKVYIEE